MIVVIWWDSNFQIVGNYYVIKLMLCELSSSGGIFTNFDFVVA